MTRRQFAFVRSSAGSTPRASEICPRTVNRGRLISTLDSPYITSAQPREVCQFFLSQVLPMTDPTQVDRHGLLEIHDASGT